MGRYDTRKIALVFESESDILKAYGKKRARMYTLPRAPVVTSEFVESLKIDPYTWKSGERLAVVANESYGNSKLWWILAWFNMIPNETVIQPGQVIYIPHPIDRVLDFYRRGK